MDTKETSSVKVDRLQGVNSLLGIGNVQCDKCQKIIRHLDRYCCNAHECPICGALFDTIAERDGHFNRQHPRQASRGTRYCVDCSFKAGYLKMVRSKKTGEVFPAMFASRDEELVESEPELQ